MNHTVRFMPQALDALERIYLYIEERSGRDRAMDFTMAIHAHCMRLQIFPLRGVRRDDIRPNLRISIFRRKVTIAYHLDDEVVFIDDVLYGGRDINLLSD